jgi:tRNA(fMet)-specific endonuclease VapC
VKRVLPDTNAISGLFIGDEKVFNYLAESENILVSVFVLGELFAGFIGGKKEKQNRKLLENFLIKNNVEILNTTKETAEIFAIIKNRLRIKGRPIPINDVWIATQAIEHNAIIVSYDKHFDLVEGLHIWNY